MWWSCTIILTMELFVQQPVLVGDHDAFWINVRFCFYIYCIVLNIDGEVFSNDLYLAFVRLGQIQK